jgi:hypothetical protein
MFERYIESARQTIYRAKWEATRLGSKEIEPEHLLLGLLGDELLVNDAFPSGVAQELRAEILSRLPQSERPLSPTDLPLSLEARIVLALGNEEADVLSGGDVETWHILLGLLRLEEGRVSHLLQEKGLSVDVIRARLPAASRKPARQPSHVDTVVPESEFTGILKKAAHLSGSGKNREALALLDDAILKAPDNWQVRSFAHFAAVVSRSIGDAQLTKSYCERRLALDAEDARALYELADCLALQGELHSAEQYAAKSHELSMVKGGVLGQELCRLIERRFPELKRNA